MPAKIQANWWAFSAFLFFALSPLFAAEKNSSTRPNIVLILADDLGFSDLGCYGSEISTPNLDRLAGEGLRFTQFYNCARCCPTRASLLSGLYPHQAGIGQMMQDLGKPGYRGELNEHCVTMAEVLRDAGYHTAMAGKWHVNHMKFTGKAQLNFENADPFWENKNNWPLQRGFEKYFGTIHGVCSYYDPFSLVRDNEPIRAEGKNFYYTDAITENATQFITDFSKTSKPFFLYVAYTAPHWPLQAPAEAIAKYEQKYLEGWDVLRERRREKMIQLGLIDKTWPLSSRPKNVPAWNDAPNKKWEAHRMATYAGMIDRMDQGIGKILQTLDQRGLTTNTLVLFLSDNGGCAENVQPGWYDIPSRTRNGRAIRVGNDPKVLAGADDVWQSYGPQWANLSDTPFRLFKHWAHEGGIATPLIARWPAQIKAEGKISNAVGHVIDFMPTFLEAAGANYPNKFQNNEIVPLEGKSLLPILKKQSAIAERPLFWEHEGNRAVRLGKWKLVAEHKKNWELFDLEKDRSELNDLAATEPEKVRQLSELYEAWAKRCGVLPWEDLKRAAK